MSRKGSVDLRDGDRAVKVRIALLTSVESVELSLVSIHPNPAAVRSLSVVLLDGAVLLRHENARQEAEVRIALGDLIEGIYTLVIEGGGLAAGYPLRYVVK